MPRRIRTNNSISSDLKPRKPYRLRRWKIDTPTGSARFFTCGRPGREQGPVGAVPDETVHRWVLGIQGPKKTIVSLLGRKGGPDGTSEFSFYSFCGGFDVPSERGNRPTFQQWLDQHHKNLEILVREHPTYDFEPIPSETLDAAAADIKQFMARGATVVVVDSGGETRTSHVCKHMGAKEDSASR